jgi:hypothetical protein
MNVAAVAVPHVPSQLQRHELASLSLPAAPCPPSIFLVKNRRDIGKSQPEWTASTIEAPRSQEEHRVGAQLLLERALDQHSHQPQHLRSTPPEPSRVRVEMTGSQQCEKR